MVATPHFGQVQKRWKNQIFNLSYSEGYNAPTVSTFVSGGTINNRNDDLEVGKAPNGFQCTWFIDETKFIKFHF